MANRTAQSAISIHGTNPQYLIEKIIRTRIYDSRYWKEHCCQITSADVLEQACDLTCVGGVYGGNIKPVPFLCLMLKLLQIQPKKDIIELFIEQKEFKYLRALGAFYLRMVAPAAEIYRKLEPLLKDYRKLRQMLRTQKYTLLHMDEFIDSLLREERVFDVILPRLQKRIVLELNKELQPYVSELEELDLIPAKAVKFEDTSKATTIFNDYYKKPDKYRTSQRQDLKHSIQSELKPIPGSGRFRQEEIDKENSIRTKLGIRLLII